jgi:hypothetical protein
MNEHDRDGKPGAEEAPLLLTEAALLANEVIEVPLLLSLRQMSALEAAAYHRGLTAGEMVRRLLQDFIADPPVKPHPFSSPAERKITVAAG